MTLTDLLIATYRNMLRTLRALLDKAETQLGAVEAEALLSASLAPDMFPLAAQVRFTGALAAAQATARPDPAFALRRP